MFFLSKEYNLIIETKLLYCIRHERSISKVISRIHVSPEKLFCLYDERDIKKVTQKERKKKRRRKKSYDARRRDVPQRNSSKNFHCQKSSSRRKNRHYGSSHLQSHLIEDRRHSYDVEGRRGGKSHAEKSCSRVSRNRFRAASTKLSPRYAAGGTFRRIYLDVSSSSAQARNMGVRIEFGMWVPTRPRRRRLPSSLVDGVPVAPSSRI